MPVLTAIPMCTPSIQYPGTPERAFPKSQANLGRTTFNPQPTAVPAPQKQFFGTLGLRHVICIAGLPHRGRNYIAHELGWYLEFFHGAEVRHFDVAQHAEATGGSREANAEGLLTELQAFLQGKSAATAQNFEDPEMDDDQKMQMTDAGKVAIIIPFRMSVLEHDGYARSRSSTDADVAATPTEPASPMASPTASSPMAPTQIDRDLKLLERSRTSWQHIWSCTNATDREWVRERLARSQAHCKLMFIELEVTEARLLRQHMASLQPESRESFKALEAAAARSYTPLGGSASAEDELSYLRLINFRDMYTHRMHGYLRMRVAQFLSVLRPWKHTIYLSRHGESTYNVDKKLGGNPGLSSLGQQYAVALGRFASHSIQVNPHTGETVRARLWTSSLIRTDQTAAHIPHPQLRAEPIQQQTFESSHNFTDPDGHTANWDQMTQRVYRQLDEIYAGEYDGLTEAQIKEINPQFCDDRHVDKLGMRYPKGESYLDLITRLEPLIHELLSYEEPLLIISHQAVLRVLRAYLLHRPRATCHAGSIPQHTVMKITWDGWHFPPLASPLETEMIQKRWPPSEAWSPSIALKDEVIGTEEWVWLGPDTKRGDGQKNI